MCGQDQARLSLLGYWYDLHAGHAPHVEPGMWAKSPITSTSLYEAMLSSRTLGRPPSLPSGLYLLVVSAVRVTWLLEFRETRPWATALL